MAKNVLLKVKGLSVGYDNVSLISDINFEVAPGEILTLIGPNGAGKSTILKSIIGQLQILGGDVTLGGTDVRKTDRKDFARKVSVLLTDRPRPELMTCEDVIAMGRYPYTGSLGILNDEDQVFVDEAMDLVHVTELRDRDFTAISDGQRQRVMLARAICQTPELMILDEPTSFLDIRYKLEFLAVLQQLARTKGMAVIMSLHEIDLAERVSDKVLCVSPQGIEKYGTPEQVFANDFIRELYGITVGSYDEASGRVELPATQGEPQVFVIGGNGTAVRTFRSMQRLGIPFAAGVLPKNDLDYPVAYALSDTVISCEVYGHPSAENVADAKKCIDSCSRVICTLDPETAAQAGLAELLEHARMVGKLAQEK